MKTLNQNNDSNSASKSANSKPPYKTIWQLSWPMIVSNLSIPLLGMVDTAVMGHMPSPVYLGAVGIGALIFSILFWGFGFLRMGTTGLVAQAYGQQDVQQIKAVLLRAWLLAGTISLLLFALQTPLSQLSFYLLDASNETERLASAYFDIRLVSAPAVLANYVIVACFVALQNTRYALYFLLFNNLINIVLDLWFVLALNWGIEGVAIASVIAEYAALLLNIYLLRKLMVFKQLQGGGWPWQLLKDIPAFKHFLTMNSHIFVRTLTLMGSLAFFTAQGAKQGELILAANVVLMNLQTFMSYGLDGFAHAAEALIGKAKGAKDKMAFELALKGTLHFSFAVAVLFSLSYVLFGQQIINLITDIEAVQQLAYGYLIWLILSPLVSVWSYAFDGIFIGATWTKEMRNTMLFSALLIYLPSFYFTQWLGLENHGLWLALLLFMAARGFSMKWVLIHKQY